MDATSLVASEHVSGVEVYNAAGELECGRGDSSMIWDAALEAGRQIFGIATDDSHVPLFDIGHAWTWVRVEEPSPRGRAARAADRALLFVGRPGPARGAPRRGHGRGGVQPVPGPRAADGAGETGCSVVAGTRGRRFGRILRTSENGLITRAVIESPWPDPKFIRVRAIDASGYSAWTNPL